MEEVDTTDPLLSSLDVSNVCVFMADALRWDYLPDEIREMGVSVKTIAASLTTHTSLPSMVTGLRPNRHGVFSWNHRIPEIANFLNHPDFDCGYYMEGEEGSVLSDGTFSVLRQDERRSLDDLEEPWFYFERHQGGHAPYEAIGWHEFDEFIDAFAGDVDRLRDEYEAMVLESVADFRERLNTIERRFGLDDTLVVFTSDHGEYLGESGVVSHNYPLRPEGVYVPTVFIHPSYRSTSPSRVMRHIDLYPTVLRAVDRPVPSFVDGVDLQRATPNVGSSLSTLSSSKLNDRRIYHAVGVWDHDGGVVWNRTPWPYRLMVASRLILGVSGNTWQPTHLRRSPSKIPSALSTVLRGKTSFGSPGVDQQSALEWITRIESETSVEEIETTELTEDTRERLEQWGYL